MPDALRPVVFVVAVVLGTFALIWALSAIGIAIGIIELALVIGVGSAVLIGGLRAMRNERKSSSV